MDRFRTNPPGSFMPINLSMPASTELKPRITVFGVGGAGGNAVNNMIECALEGVEFVVANTDAQAVGLSKAQRKIQLGTGVTQGLGAGSQPEIGEAAAQESLEEIEEHLGDAHMLFITAGMGGGTGTGAAPVIAKAAKDRGVLTVGVVTKPFHFEGARRMRIAEAGIEELQKHVDTLLIIPNQNLFKLANEKTTFAEAFGMADQVLHSGVRGITDLMVMPGLINLDFADVRTVMSEMGKAMMGTGEAESEKRAVEAAERAISNPLLDEVSMRGARGVLINITGGMDMTLFEVDEAANRIRQEVDPDANIIVGSTFNNNLEGRMRVSVVATGIEAEGEAAAPSRPAVRAEAAAPRAARPAPAMPWRPAEPAASEEGAAAHAAAAANPVAAAREHIMTMLTKDAEQPSKIIDEAAEDVSAAGDDDGFDAEPPETVVRPGGLFEASSTPPAPNPFRARPAPDKGSLVDQAKKILKDVAPQIGARPAPRAPAPAVTRPPVQARERRSDLFDDEEDEELKIPAFLRQSGA